MGKLMKFLYSLMLIVLILLGALFLAFGIDGQAVFEAFVYNEYLNMLVSNEVFIQIFFMAVGILLIGFAIILLVVLRQNSNKGFDVLIEDEKGSVLIAQRSLESSIKSSVNKFLGLETIKARAKIIDNNKLEAKILVDDYSDQAIDKLSERVREEIKTSLTNLTGLDEIKIDLKIEKKEKQKEKRENARY